MANLSNSLMKTDKMSKQINDADVAELVDARDLKFLAADESSKLFGLTPAENTMATYRTSRDLFNQDR